MVSFQNGFGVEQALPKRHEPLPPEGSEGLVARGEGWVGFYRRSGRLTEGFTFVFELAGDALC
jgi:hypothetical protein